MMTALGIFIAKVACGLAFAAVAVLSTLALLIAVGKGLE